MIAHADKELSYFTQRFIPVDATLENDYSNKLSASVRDWFSKWFGGELTFHSNIVDHLHDVNQEGITIIWDDIVLMRFSCSVNGLLKLLTGHEPSGEIKYADKLVEKILEDLLVMIGMPADRKLEIKVTKEKILMVPQAKYYLECEEQLFEVSFFSETYAWYVASIATSQPNINGLSDKFEALSEQNVSVHVGIEGVRLKAKELMELQVGNVLISKNELSKPVSLNVSKTKVGQAFIGKENEFKAIRLGGK